ncbi:MAG: lysylphosphatidylglycerol synthase domain-containing protein [Myxococcota bacterium]
MSQGPSLRTTLGRILPLLVSGAVLVWLFRRTDPAALADAIDARVVAVLLPSLLVYGFGSLAIDAISIRRLVPPGPAPLSLWTAARLKCASYLLGIFHYALGAASLTVLLRRRTSLSLTGAGSVVLLIALTDLLVVLASASVAIVAGTQLQLGPQVGVIFAALGACATGIFVLRWPGSLGPLDRLRELAIFDGLRNIPLARLGELLVLRCLFCTGFVAICVAAFVAFGISAPPVQMVAGFLIAALVAALPIAVAGLGTSQAAFLFLFEGIASPERLLAMSLALSFGLISMRVAMGIAFARELTREAWRERDAAA